MGKNIFFNLVISTHQKASKNLKYSSNNLVFIYFWGRAPRCTKKVLLKSKYTPGQKFCYNQNTTRRLSKGLMETVRVAEFGV